MPQTIMGHPTSMGCMYVCICMQVKIKKKKKQQTSPLNCQPPALEYTREVKKSSDSGIGLESEQPPIYDNVSYTEGPNSTQSRTPAPEVIREVKKSSDSGISVLSDQTPIYDNISYTEGPKEGRACSNYDSGISMGSEFDQAPIYNNVPHTMGLKKGKGCIATQRQHHNYKLPMH